MAYTVDSGSIQQFSDYLLREERCAGTVERYLRDVRAFSAWLGDRELSKEAVGHWKAGLTCCAPTTVNAKLSAVNGFLKFLGRGDCCVKFLKIQRRVFRDRSRNLTREEFTRLLNAAEARGRRRLSLLMETICATGIRVSEVQYVTVEAAREGRADISLKGKVRTILLPGKLCRKLLKYARRQKIASGTIFRTRSGKPISRRQIWAEMKALCDLAGVERSKVFPHNLRHLFARMFYRATRDIVKLSDVLGHSSIETTRVYLISTGEEHARVLDSLRLVS